jgi:hypothetical protein
MAPVQKLACAVAVLTAIALFAVALNTTQDELLEASAVGDLSRVETLLAAKTNVNAKDQHGYTALIVASGGGARLARRGGRCERQGIQWRNGYELGEKGRPPGGGAAPGTSPCVVARL